MGLTHFSMCADAPPPRFSAFTRLKRGCGMIRGWRIHKWSQLMVILYVYQKPTATPNTHVRYSSTLVHLAPTVHSHSILIHKYRLRLRHTSSVAYRTQDIKCTSARRPRHDDSARVRHRHDAAQRAVCVTVSGYVWTASHPVGGPSHALLLPRPSPRRDGKLRAYGYERSSGRTSPLLLSSCAPRQALSKKV